MAAASALPGPALVAAAVIVALISQLYRPAFAATLLSDLTADDRQAMTFALYRFGLHRCHGAAAPRASGPVSTWPGISIRPGVLGARRWSRWVTPCGRTSLPAKGASPGPEQDASGAGKLV